MFEKPGRQIFDVFHLFVCSDSSGGWRPDDIASPSVVETANPLSLGRSVPEARTLSAVNHADAMTGTIRTEFSCQSCATSFSADRSLHRHMALRHSHQSFFKCLDPICAETFSIKSIFDRHICANSEHPRAPHALSVMHWSLNGGNNVTSLHCAQRGGIIRMFLIFSSN